MGLLDAFLQSYSSVTLLGALVVLLFVFFISSFSFSSQENERDPPGPKPLPLLGNLLQLDLKRPYNTLLKFSKKYGSVFTVYLGPQKVVVLAGYKTVKEALVNNAEEFGERDPMQIINDTNPGHGKGRISFQYHVICFLTTVFVLHKILINPYVLFKYFISGVIWSNGDSWKEMRRFALTNLRDFGMGKKACEDKIIEESHYLIDVFKKFKGEAFDTSQPMNYAISNIICSMVYGSRFEYDDPEFTSMVDRINRNIQLLASPSIQVYNQFPCIGKWLSVRNEILKLTEANKKQNLRLFSRLKETLNPDMCRGFVDAFLVRKQQLEECGNTKSHFHDANLLMTVLNLFAAGTDTTATTLRWALLLMVKYPKIQEQVREELNRVIGSRQVQVEDRKNLPFTDAVIHETQRLANIVPVALPHKTSQDITFQGYFIKKGTTVYPLLTSVLYDEKEWERPHTFNPAHFLDKDGKFVKRDAFMPFSAGRRICLGESLARMELFIFFTTLLQHFRFTPSPGVSEDELDLTPRIGLTLNPSPHKLCAIPCL
uniref:Cytochrome P450 2K1-like n=1 Tax=Mastacembelus armatus TaxID=205130 RepID=A0A7N8XPI4_9TELE